MGTPDQNQFIGKLALRHLDRRMKLVEIARGSRRWGWMDSVIIGLSAPVILTVVDMFFPHTSYSMRILLCLLPGLFLVGADVRRAHSRLDALVQLLGEENLLNEA